MSPESSADRTRAPFGDADSPPERKAWLVISNRLPAYDRSAGDLRMFEMLRIGSELGWKITFLDIEKTHQNTIYSPQDAVRYRQALSDIQVELASDKSVESVLRERPWHGAVYQFFHVASRFQRLHRAIAPHTRFIVDSVDIAFERLLAKARLSTDPEQMAHALRTQKLEIATYRQADVVISVSDEEADTLRKLLVDTPVSVVPVIYPPWTGVRAEFVEPELLFVGSFRHDPNADAVLYFHREVWPEIRSEFPRAHWTIVGPDPPREVMELASDAIEVTGFVTSTTPYLARAWVSIAPLRFGAGMKGKVCEAMNAGVPVVTTRIGAQGVNALDGRDFLVADEATEFASHVKALLHSPRRREEMSLASRQFITRLCDPLVVRDSLQALESIVGRSSIKRTPLNALEHIGHDIGWLWRKYAAWRFR